jgi:hypothetical protein
MIEQNNRRAACEARENDVLPYLIVNPQKVDEWPPFPFPEVGDAADDYDESFTRIDTLFVDSSGWGSPGEPALTTEQFKDGQFQLYVGVWV